MPQCQFLFSAVFYSRKAVLEIFLELDETKSQGPIFSVTYTESEGETKGGTEAPSPCGGVGPTPGAPPRGEEPSGLHRHRPFAYKLPFSEKP